VPTERGGDGAFAHGSRSNLRPRSILCGSIPIFSLKQQT